MRSDRLRAVLAGSAAFALAAVTATAAVAQTGEASVASAPDGFTTEEFEPGVERVLSDAAGHDLIARHPDHPRDMDHIAIGPDGTIWIAGTASRGDNGFLQGFIVWRMGQPGIWGIEDGVPEYIQTLSVAEDGTVWAIGSSVATFDGESWKPISDDSPFRLATPDGTLWFVSDAGGVEAWDGTETRRYLTGLRINEIGLADDGTIWAVGHLRGSEDGAVFRINPEAAS